MTTRILFIFAILISKITLFSQSTINFKSVDDVQISADFYEGKPEAPFLLLFHQAGYSRGEYKEIAPRLTKLGYNVLAVDLRSGNEVNYINNQTAENAKAAKKETDFIDAEKDIIAAINWAYAKTKKPVVLLGSSYSASLALKVAVNNSKVKAVAAFSPGEYFLSDRITIKNEIKDLTKPIFATCALSEYDYLTELFQFVVKNKTLYKPRKGEGKHGAKALWKDNPNAKEYWFALTMFLRNYID